MASPSGLSDWDSLCDNMRCMEAKLATAQAALASGSYSDLMDCLLEAKTHQTSCQFQLDKLEASKIQHGSEKPSGVACAASDEIDASDACSSWGSSTRTPSADSDLMRASQDPHCTSPCSSSHGLGTAILDISTLTSFETTTALLQSSSRWEQRLVLED